MQSIIVAEKGANTKIEQYLQNIYPNLSFGTLQKAFRRRDIKANGIRINKDYIVAQGDRLEIFITDELLNGTGNVDAGNAGRTTHINKFTVVYEDNDIIIVNKAQGIPVQPDKEQSDGTLIDQVRKYLRESNNRLTHEHLEEEQLTHEHPENEHPVQEHPTHKQHEDKYPAGNQTEGIQTTINQTAYSTSPDNHIPVIGSFQPSLCHRLDRNTGGLVIIAKNPSSYNFILEKLESREIKKYYQCLVKGKMGKNELQLKAYLWKDAVKSRVFISDYRKPGAQEIITAYKVLDYDPNNDISRLEVELITGRTHQIRAHMAHIGHPIIGDGKYGTNSINRVFGMKHQALWACRLKFDFTQGNQPQERNKLPQGNVPLKDNKLSKGNVHLSNNNNLNNLNGNEFIVYPEFKMKLKL